MALFGITGVRLDQDGWVDMAEFVEIGTNGQFVAGSACQRSAARIAAQIKAGAEVYCIFGGPDDRGSRFEVVRMRDGSDGIKLVNDVLGRGLQQLIQLETPSLGQKNPVGTW